MLARDVDASVPLFLVLNFIQAHDPWVAPDPDLGWDLLDPQMTPADFKADFRRYLRNTLEPSKEEVLRAQLIDLYDYGVYREDRFSLRSRRAVTDAAWRSSEAPRARSLGCSD